MSYSRWGGRGSGHWYTYWRIQDKDTENFNTALFDVCGVHTFTAMSLRTDLEECLNIVREKDSIGDLDELKIYIAEFLKEVAEEY